jgi:hypothetical protein
MKEPQLQNSHPAGGLAEVVAALEARVAALEKHLGLAAEIPAMSSPAVQVEVAPGEVSTLPHAAPHEHPRAAPHATPQLPSLGGAMLMLAGAFLLRALTEAGLLNATLGVALGLVYMLSLF